MKTVAIAGMGNMGAAIAERLRAAGSGGAAVDRFLVKGLGRADDANEVLADCDILILGMKPQDFSAFADSVKMDMSEKLVISIMAGVSVAKISEKLGAKRVVRTIPNLALKQGLSFTVWFAGAEASSEDKELVREILALMGEEMEVQKEEDLNYVTALSGCGPAYFYYLAEILEKAAMENGIASDVAEKLARVTFLGAAKYLETENAAPSELRARVSSKGGCTEAAIKHLGEKGVEGAFMEAFKKAADRAKELSD